MCIRDRINIDNRWVGVSLTKCSYLNTIGNQSTFGVNLRLSNFSTAGVSKCNSRNEVVSTTRILDSNGINLSCCVINSQRQYSILPLALVGSAMTGIGGLYDE